MESRQMTQSREGPEQEQRAVLAEQVDVDVDMSPSAQVMLGHPRPEENREREDKHERDYANYESPLASYPLLRSRARFSSTAEIVPHGLESYTISLPFSKHLSPITDSVSLSTASVPFSHLLQTDIHFPDLRLLKLAAVSKSLDPLKRICQYEVPGGGVCRDEECEDIHLGRLIDTAGGIGKSISLEGVEPNDKDAAEYLFYRLPTDWLNRYKIKSPGEIESALELQKNSGPRIVIFEERVTRALAALEGASCLEALPE
ncbi:hypothetical protein AX17_006268 [Amanita inopinata Kibby_2008]|nr:hypothetical protein AX17_006268 [Amanita inopinata Kibby_2008]